MQTTRAMQLRRIILMAVPLVLLAVGLFLLYQWYMTTRLLPAWELETARTRWQARPFDHYTLHVEQQPNSLLPVPGAGVYDVRSETLNTWQQRMLQRSVSSYFEWIEQYPQSVQFECRTLNVPCVRRITYHVEVVYDEHLGYPRRIELIQTRQHDWSNPRFWHWLIASGNWRQCENMQCTTTERATIRIVSLTPIP